MGKELALLLGMLCGDGCLVETIRKNKKYKFYSTRFYNSNLDLMKNFDNLFLEVFGVKGNYYPEKTRVGKKKVSYTFRSYSREVFNRMAALGFPVGLKKYKLRVPSVIWDSGEKEKLFFLKGLVLTDGSIKKGGDIVFHMASKRFLEDVSDLIYEIFDSKRQIKEYLQKEKYLSYQLRINKKDSQRILSQTF